MQMLQLLSPLAHYPCFFQLFVVLLLPSPGILVADGTAKSERFCFVIGIVLEEATGLGVWGQSCVTSTVFCPEFTEVSSQAELRLE